VVIPVVRAAFRPGCVLWGNPANARAARISGLRLSPSWIASGPRPKQACYQRAPLLADKLLNQLHRFNQSNCFSFI